jgi:hypothetical protein
VGHGANSADAQVAGLGASRPLVFSLLGGCGSALSHKNTDRAQHDGNVPAQRHLPAPADFAPVVDPWPTEGHPAVRSRSASLYGLCVEPRDEWPGSEGGNAVCLSLLWMTFPMTSRTWQRGQALISM